MQTKVAQPDRDDKVAPAPIRRQDAASTQKIEHYRDKGTNLSLLRLQRMHGNRFVQRIIQKKLEVRHPGDPYEREADQVANRIMSMSALGAQPVAQRVAVPDVEKDKLQPGQAIPVQVIPALLTQFQVPLEEEGRKLGQAAASHATTGQAADGVRPHAERAISAAASSPGQSLPANLQRKFEQALRADLSAIRVHTGSHSVEASKAIGARAYTTGNDIHFDQDLYNPESSEGQHLLAHEVAHTVQQGGSSTVQRKPPRKAQSDTAHVGGELGSMTFLEGPGGTTLAPGEAGYARRMLAETGTVAEKFEGYQEARLVNVAPSFTVIDKQIKKRGDEVAYFNDKKDEWFNLPSTVQLWTRASDWCKNHGQELETNRASEEETIAAYNAWVPRANGFFTSLTRLDAMQDMLGVKDPKAMAAALTKGLGDAQAIAQRMQLAHDKGEGETPDIPAVDESLAEVSAAATQAAQEMNTAYLGFQQIVLVDRGVAVNAEGEQDRNRLQQINEVKSFARNVGKTVDVTMSVVQGAPAAISRATTTVARAGATANAMRNRRLINAGKAPRHNPTYVTVDDKGNMIVRNVQTGMDRPIEGGEQTASPEGEGLKLPTSVSDLLGTIADFAYSGEVREINMRLESIKARCDMISGAAELIKIREKTQNLQDKLNAFALKCNELQNRIQQRRQAYLEFGVQLDNFARKDQESRQAGLAPGQGEERYATILAVVSSVREVLSLGEGAVGGFSSAREIESWAQSLNWVRTKSPPRTDIEYFKLPDSEWKPLEKMWSNVKTFGDNVGMLRMMFAGVETQARTLIGELHQGSGGAGGAY